MNKKAAQSNISLLLAAAIWGLAFVAQSDAMNYIGPFAFTSIRYFIGSFALVPVFAFTLSAYKKKNGKEAMKASAKKSVLSGMLSGFALFFASVAQQIGLKYTAAGKAGFITALYIVLVPVLGRVVLKSKSSINTWVSVVIAAAGLYLLCMNGSFSVEKGDLMLILCAFLFSVQILIIDRCTKDTDTVLVSSVQFLTAGIISIPFALLLEGRTTLDMVYDARLSILYTGLLSTAVAFTLQIVGQKSSGNPTVASLLMSMESVFAAIFGWLILKESFSGREFCGVILMSAAIVLSQIPSHSFKKRNKHKST